VLLLQAVLTPLIFQLLPLIALHIGAQLFVTLHMLPESASNPSYPARPAFRSPLAGVAPTALPSLQLGRI
jgi:hypothetical protein